MKRLQYMVLALAAGSVPLASPVAAQSSQIQSASKRVTDTIASLDRLWDENDDVVREGKQLDREHEATKRKAYDINWTITNFNNNCTGNRTHARQCPQWEREIIKVQAEIERDRRSMASRTRDLTERKSNLYDRMDQLNDRLADATQALAAACRAAPELERTWPCYPDHYRGMGSDAFAIISRHLPTQY